MPNRQETMRLLREVRDVSALFPLVRKIDKETPVSIANDRSAEIAVRENAISLLAQVPDARVITLLRRLAWGDPDVDMRAAEALGSIKTPEAERALQSLLNAPSALVRRQVVRALGPRENCYPAVLQAISKETDPDTIDLFLSSPSIPPRPESIPLVLGFLKHPHDRVRKSALFWLGRASRSGVLQGYPKEQIARDLKDMLAREPARHIRDKARELLARL